MTLVFVQEDGDPPADDPAKSEGDIIADEQEAQRTENRRMWCLQQAMQVSLTALRFAPAAPMVDITKTAEEMCEFIETGVARTHQAPSSKQ